MNKSYVFRPLNNTDNSQLIHKFGLNYVLSNGRTSIYENSNMRLSIDKKVIRVLLFDDNKILLENLRNYFYGEEYTKIQWAWK